MKPITVIPWDRDFIAGLASYLVERFQGRFQDVVVLFAHRRPRRYLQDRLFAEKRLQKPCLLPRILSMGELVLELCQHVHPAPLRLLTRLDQVGLLHQVVGALGAGLRCRTDGFPTQVKDFFPWGLRLAGLMEELFRQGVTAQNLLHLQDQVMPTAATLLANLQAIQAGYRQAMLAQDAATPGLAAALVADRADRAVLALEGKLVLACGFNALSGAEEALLALLWRSGAAEILWHTDPEVASAGGAPHWSCREHVDWLKRWKAVAEVHTDEKRSPLPVWRKRADQLSLFAAASQTPPPKRSQILFHQGFDLHTQLGALSRQLAAQDDLGGSAVVLTDTSMLTPVLHHLPRRDVNVSMGFPLSRSPLYQLVDHLLRLQDGRAPAGYHWREFVACLRHPLLQFLEVDGAYPLRHVYHAWEEVIRQGEKFVDPQGWTPDDAVLSAMADPAAVLALKRRVEDVCFTAFADIRTPRAMAQALAGLARLLMDPAHGSRRWERFVIDAQCLARMLDSVIPELGDSMLSDQEFDPATVRSMTRELFKNQRVPFEADPLSGLQVLGMLETRLLTFERVYVLGASEELLPGSPSPDPLLPDPLRAQLGLPDLYERDMVAAHTFYRLIQGAREVNLYYSTGSQPGILDAKTLPSRYVEQLIWEEEKRQGKKLDVTDAPRHLITLPMHGVATPSPAVANTPACRRKLETLLRYKNLSATFLDDFIACPLRFFYTHLTPLDPLAEVAEEGDLPAFGQLVHSLLQDFFQPHINQPITAGDLDAKALDDMFAARLEKEPFFTRMPAHARLSLLRAGARRLNYFVQAVPDTTVLKLETKLATTLEVDGASYKLRGAVDRVDARPEGLVVLDYKTGKPKQPAKGFWENEPLWEWIASPDPAADLDFLPQLSAGLKSVQLPLYLWLHHEATGVLPANGAFVCLGDAGQESWLFNKQSEELRERHILEDTPALLRCVMRLILSAPQFSAIPSRACAWCPYRQACGRLGV